MTQDHVWQLLTRINVLKVTLRIAQFGVNNTPEHHLGCQGWVYVVSAHTLACVKHGVKYTLWAFLWQLSKGTNDKRILCAFIACRWCHTSLYDNFSLIHFIVLRRFPLRFLIPAINCDRSNCLRNFIPLYVLSSCRLARSIKNWHCFCPQEFCVSVQDDPCDGVDHNCIICNVCGKLPAGWLLTLRQNIATCSKHRWNQWPWSQGRFFEGSYLCPTSQLVETLRQIIEITNSQWIAFQPPEAWRNASEKKNGEFWRLSASEIWSADIPMTLGHVWS